MWANIKKMIIFEVYLYANMSHPFPSNIFYVRRKHIEYLFLKGELSPFSQGQILYVRTHVPSHF